MNNHNLTVGQKIQITFKNDVDYVNCTTIWEIKRVDDKRFYYQSHSALSIVGRSYSLLNRKSVTFTTIS